MYKRPLLFSYDYELVGRITGQGESQGRLLYRFQCTNKEDFEYVQARSLHRADPGGLIRVFLREVEGSSPKELACIHWEEL